MFKGTNKHQLLLHFIVLIWGFSPILGRFITCSTMQLVWFRILFTQALITTYIIFTKTNLKVNFKTLLKLAGIGIVIAMHWLCFYGAIKASNVSVTMAAFSTLTLFTALIEPLILKRKVLWYELLIGLIIIGAICLIFSVEITFWQGIILGILAAFTGAIFSVCNSLMIKETNSTTISYIELWFAVIGLSIYLGCTGGFTNEFFVLNDQAILGLILLAGICTAFPFIASVNLMKHLSPYTINLTVNLETVYGIVLAIFIYKENKELSLTFYIGVMIILLAVFSNAYLKSRDDRKKLVV
ncbi:MAG TPA: DMT family transporter [Bacteroidia bacterium]|jgi:drug/metabolite transporter (DMT)-like permease|nr:DMT family transporter [Bacteroidia bacterium]